MNISIIAAVSDNNVIGRANGLPWHLSTDLKRFKALTMGHPMVMGRKTFDSIGRVLPGRRTIVITRHQIETPGVEVVRSVDDALVDGAFICGGAEIYAQTIHRASRMYLTRVHAEIEGDAYFPEFDEISDWHLTDREDHESDENNDYNFSFLVYDRVGHAERPMAESG
jgi:dihydrofolate reductase